MKKIYLTLVFASAFVSGLSQNVILDPAFGNNGIVKTDFPLNESFDYHLAKKILASDDGTSFLLFEINDRAVIVHLKEDGSINIAYGENGYSIPARMKPQSAALQNDGKIVVAGSADLTNGNGFGFALARYGIDGALDPTFGNGGTIQTEFVHNGSSSRGIANAVALQIDGKIVVGGQSDEANGAVFTIARYNTDGSLDASFDGDGKVFSLINDSRIQDLKLQSDGRIIAAGYSTTSWGTEFTIARYNSDGSPDHGFDGDGVVQTPFSYNGSAANAYANSMALQSDGTIVVAGHSAVNGVAAFTLARYKSDGSLDESFDEDGKSQTNSPYNGIEFFDVFSSVAIQNNGKIVAAGFSRFPPYSNLFAVARFDTDGRLDEGFGENGMSFTSLSDPNSSCQAYSVVLQGDEKILVAGISNINIYSNSAYAVSRYNTDGSLDDSFDDDGKKVDFIKTGISSFSATAVQDDRKIIAAGVSRIDGAGSGFALTRYNTDGSLDASFDGDGNALTSFLNGSNSHAAAKAIVLHANGKIIAGGNSATTLGVEFTLCRYNSDGSLDASFDGDGKVQTPFIYEGDKSNASISSMVVQSDGKIVAAGVARTDGGSFNNVFALTRYHPDGSLDASFDGDGKVQTPFVYNGIPVSAILSSIALQTDGKIIAVGSIGTAFVIVRYNQDGSVDESFDGDGKVEILFTSATPFSFSYANSVVIQNDGKIIIAGFTQMGSPVDAPKTFSVARLNQDGSLDANFDGDGKLQTVISYNGNNIPSIARSVSLQDDGRIIVAGTSGYIRSGSIFGFTVARYTTDGSLDAGFENNGTSQIWVDKADFSTSASSLITNNRIFYPGSGVYYGQVSAVAALLIKGIDDDDDGSNNEVDCAPADKTKWQSTELYIDADGDGYDAGRASICYGSTLPNGYSLTTRGPDCNDNSNSINPGTTEVCGNNADDDCDGLVDEGCNTAHLPKVYIGNTSVTEGNNGTRNATFILLLSKLSNKPVTLQYKTVNNTAIAPGDFIQKSGTVTFPAYSFLKTITVKVKSDRLDEADEKFTIELSNAINATIAVNSAFCIIKNDDGAPAIRINDASATESSQLALVKVDLSEASERIVKVKYNTKDGSAKAPGDYTAISNGVLVFQPGEITKYISIVVKQDALNESTEKFKLILRQAENADLSSSHGDRSEAEIKIYNSASNNNTMTKGNNVVELKVTTAPVPFYDQLHFNITAPESGGLKISLFDVNGTSIGILKQDVKAGIPVILTYKPKMLLQGMLFYKVTIGNHSLSGKVIRVED